MNTRVGGVRRHLSLFVVSVAAALLLGACASTALLPNEDDVSTSFPSYEAVEAAYSTVHPGETPADLARAGFDETTAPNLEKLSYLGVMDRFLVGSSVRFDALAPAVQTCIQAQEHCSAVIFRTEHIHQQREGSLVWDLLGFRRVTESNGWSAEVIFLMQDENVVYKVLQGKPRIHEIYDRRQPLGPAQDLGGTVWGIGTHVKL